MKIAVLGVSGMLGSAAFQLLSEHCPGNVWGTSRSSAASHLYAPEQARRIVTGLDVQDPDALAGFVRDVRPDVILNCIGIVKQLDAAGDPLLAIPINALLPHRLARLASLTGARLVHISTDCVFTGRKGAYRECDKADAEDLYGRSKLLGEVDYENAVTLRTSIIGREIGSQRGLVEWFLSQSGHVRGYKRAIFSGLTTDELVRVIANHVIPNQQLRGVYHVSVAPINKFDLLSIIRSVYGCPTMIDQDDAVVIDRSLNSERFRSAVGYKPPSWPELITRMREFDDKFYAQVR